MSTSLGTLLKAALSGIASGRVYPGSAPDTPTKPYVTYFYFGPVLSDLRGRTDLQNRNIQIDVWDSVFLTAESTADDIEAAMGLQSHIGSPPRFTAIPVRREHQYESETKIHHILLEFSVWFVP